MQLLTFPFQELATAESASSNENDFFFFNQEVEFIAATQG